MVEPVRKITWDELDREDLGGGMSRSALGNDQAMLVFNYLEPGSGVTTPHAHDFDQIALVLEGAMEFTCDGTAHAVGAGEALVIPAGVQHCGKVLGDQRAVNLDVFAPAREDYRHLYAWMNR
jgi:quercetin dioxygenase-like cupin family protein